MTDNTKRQWDNSIKKQGVTVEKPQGWHPATLRHWQGINKDFNWGKEAHKRMGNKQLNHEGRTKINNAMALHKFKANRGKIARGIIGQKKAGENLEQMASLKTFNKEGQVTRVKVPGKPGMNIRRGDQRPSVRAAALGKTPAPKPNAE